MKTFGGAKSILCVTYIGLLLSLYTSFHGSRGMTTEASSNSSMGFRRLAPRITDSSIPYKSWKNKLQMSTLVCGVDKKEQEIIVLLQPLSNN